MKNKYGLAVFAALFILSPFLMLVAQAADPYFVNLDFRNRWVEQDHLVGSPGVDRPYAWGPNIPEAFNALFEPYNTSPGGSRQVQYFDKARMELNQPTNGIITAGLLTKELVSGLRQDGDTTFTRLNPSRTQVAGDPVSVNPDAPVYATFGAVVTLGNPDEHSQPNSVGQVINAFINKDGQVSTNTPPENITIGAYESNTGHNIAKPFQDFKQLKGPVTDPVSGTTIPNQPVFTNDPITNVFGLAISEPYWVSTRVAGVARTILVQLFERRVLTYNPAIIGASKVEMGNLGQHYYQWRYVESQPTLPLTPTRTSALPPGQAIQTVFIIMMENHNWIDIKGNSSAPYINNTLLPQASYTERYYNPPGIHPSLPNYLWLEAGTNFGILDDKDPSADHQKTTAHLTTQLNQAGLSWKAYQEGISGTNCPLTNSGRYAVRHNPMVYFDDVTNTNNSGSAYCISHERPYSELATDLVNDTISRYNFITPDVCDDMHNTAGCATNDSVKNGDSWLSTEVPKILSSTAYQKGGALFITWDEGTGSDGPVGMIVLSPNARGGGYSNSLSYTHGSTLRTFQEIFGLTPLLGDAANAISLSDLFKSFP